jgi:hypothetical protein
MPTEDIARITGHLDTGSLRHYDNVVSDGKSLPENVLKINFVFRACTEGESELQADCLEPNTHHLLQQVLVL